MARGIVRKQGGRIQEPDEGGYQRDEWEQYWESQRP